MYGVTNFFGHLIAQLYMHSYADSVYLCGDFKVRTGSLVDTAAEDSDVLPRISLDKERNNTGEKLVEFVKDMNLALVNGRLPPDFDDFTSISSRGRSIVDYFITEQISLSNISNFCVHTVTNLLAQYNLHSDRGGVK